MNLNNVSFLFLGSICTMATGGNLIDTDSEDELPAGWQERVAADGRVYYAR